MAVMIAVSLVMGGFVFSNIAWSHPDKAQALAGHMIAGAVIGVLLVIRLIVRRVTLAPPPASSGTPTLGIVARTVHVALYLLVGLMVLSGLTMALRFDLFAFAFNETGLPVTNGLRGSGLHMVHKIAGFALLGLIVLHVAAAIYHTFVLKDGLLSRMWFGPR
ncbi:unnamed protein product [Effrenium voratum]|uniref:Cytochrome b561 bacterial/Ni-hydrogenase domain-containing protein n=1 Tax=Effrenium voratum TaxID=2562239 RepID=A0AA36IQQ6_9DINO|nr:unnamed protein product [Effrenium voratum]